MKTWSLGVNLHLIVLIELKSILNVRNEGRSKRLLRPLSHLIERGWCFFRKCRQLRFDSQFRPLIDYLSYSTYFCSRWRISLGITILLREGGTGESLQIVANNCKYYWGSTQNLEKTESSCLDGPEPDTLWLFILVFNDIESEHARRNDESSSKQAQGSWQKSLEVTRFLPEKILDPVATSVGHSNFCQNTENKSCNIWIINHHN